MPEANSNKNLLKGTWGAQIEWSVSLMKPPNPADINGLSNMLLTMHDDRLIAIFRFSFDPLPDDDTPGTFKFYSATNHGGNVRGKIVNGVGDFNTAGAFSSGRYSINPDGASGWLAIASPTVTSAARFSFVITNKNDELLLSLTEMPAKPDAPPAKPSPPPQPTINISGQAWGIAKRD